MSHVVKTWNPGGFLVTASSLQLHTVLDVIDVCGDELSAEKDHANMHAHTCTGACMLVHGFCWMMLLTGRAQDGQRRDEHRGG